MKSKNLIVFFLTGLFVMNLMAFQSGAMLQVLTGKDVTVVHPFCKKSKSISTAGDSVKLDLSATHSFDISVICNTVFNFKTTSFSFIPAEDNFKNDVFSETLHLNLFAERFYLPPRANIFL